MQWSPALLVILHLLRERAAFGKFSASLAEVGRFSLSKPSWEPRESLVQSDAAGASWGREGWKETGKQALVSPGGSSYRSKRSPFCALQAAALRAAVAAGITAVPP